MSSNNKTKDVAEKLLNKIKEVEITRHNFINIIENNKAENDFANVKNINSMFNKYVGTSVAEILKEEIKEIVGSKYNVSPLNSFIEGYPTEWDLLILNNNVKDTKCTYKLKEVAALVEFKTAGLFPADGDVQKCMVNELNVCKLINKENEIPFIYITLAETEKTYEATKEVFDKYKYDFYSYPFVFTKFNKYNEVKDKAKKGINSELPEYDEYKFEIDKDFKDLINEALSNK